MCCSRRRLEIWFRSIQSTRNAEITEFDLSVGVHQEIRWFDVSMDDSLIFQIVQTHDHLQKSEETQSSFERRARAYIMSTTSNELIDVFRAISSRPMHRLIEHFDIRCHVGHEDVQFILNIEGKPIA